MLAADSIPMVLLLLFGGVIADRLPRVLLLRVGNLVIAGTQGAVALLVLTDTAELWMLVALRGRERRRGGAQPARRWPA